MQGLLDATTITRVWLALGGPEPKRGRAPAFYRDGNNQQAVSLNDAKGCWFDYRDGVGGGVLGRGFPFYRVGRSILYDLDEVRALVRAARVEGGMGRPAT